MQAFRDRYGRGWDNVEMRENERGDEKARKEGRVDGGEVSERVEEESLVDLLSGGDFVKADGGKKKRRVAMPVEEVKVAKGAEARAGAAGKK